ncbi:hypothetical protein BC941DRAFT_457119 [Chlamydoabsidia padenii]|nr:hypothetical protein BC941DRAFT_457119 [Chlamydoabsidia padenii]
MKTTSIIALSSFIASSVLTGVNGQMLPLEGSNGAPAPAAAQPLKQDTPAPPVIKGVHKRPVHNHQMREAQILAPPPDVVHITKTRTEIVYPPPNPRLWKYLPAFPANGPQGKIVAEFKVDEHGHFHKYGGKHGGWNHHKGGDELHRLAIKGEGYPHQQKGYHHSGEVYYEGIDGGHKGKGEEHPHHGKGEHGKGDAEWKKKDHPHHGKGDEEPSKKKGKGPEPKQADGFISAQSINGTDSAVSGSVSASAVSAQKTDPALASGVPKNAAASSSSAASHSSSSAKPSSSSSSTSSTSASSNTHQVAVSFVAMMATVAVWCLA